MSKASNLIANLRGFLAAADPAGRVHPQVNTLRAKTARMSITNPALQTLKKHDPRLRRCFTADPGHVLISCDFSQVEVRVAAALADDPTLQQVILSGADIHDATAALMYGEGFTDEQRTISKRATFGTIYGGGARALASQTGVPRGHRPAGDPAVAAHLPAGDRLRAAAGRAGRGGHRQRAAHPRRPGPARTRTPTTRSSPPPGTCCSPPSTPWSPATRWAGCGCSCMTRSSSRPPSHDAERIRGLLERAMTSTFRGLPIVAEAKILGPAWGQHDPAAPAPGKSGTSGTSGTCAGQHGSGGFRRAAGVPEPPEPAEPSPRPSRSAGGHHGPAATAPTAAAEPC